MRPPMSNPQLVSIVEHRYFAGLTIDGCDNVVVIAWNDDQTEFVVSADNMFLSEAFQQIKSAPDSDDEESPRFRLGELNREGQTQLASRLLADWSSSLRLK